MSSKPTRALKRRTESESLHQANLKRGKTEIRQGLADIFRAELAILLDEHKGQMVLVPAVPEEGVDERLYIGVFQQDADYLAAEMQKRLALDDYHPTAWQIREYLSQVSRIMEARMSQSEEEGFNPYTGETNGTTALPYVNRRFLMPKREKPEPKKRGRKPLHKKRGKRRPVVVNGKQYESIKQADKETGLGYQYLQKRSLKELKENRL